MMDDQVDASGMRCLESRPDPVATRVKGKVGREGATIGNIKDNMGGKEMRGGNEVHTDKAGVT